MSKPLTIYRTHPLATPQYFREDILHEGRPVLFWLPSSIEYIDKINAEVEIMKAQRLGRTGRD